MDSVIRGVQPAGDFALSAAETGESFDALFREHYPAIVAVLAKLTGDRGQAEEVASDVFCKLSRRPELLREENLRAWLYRVATNAGLDALRSNKRRRSKEEAAGTDNLQAGAADALDGILREERCARVRDVLASLKPRDAQLLLLRSSGLAYRDLAETIGVQPASIGTLLARAEQEFERKFRARYGDFV
jgi:RNA polymerase sigma-70 factor (ECF subfamily)